MKINETDLRVKKTKDSIKNALFDLIEVHGFETITVKELTTKAKINRGTFYLHYENIDDLIDEYYSIPGMSDEEVVNSCLFCEGQAAMSVGSESSICGCLIYKFKKIPFFV